MVHTPPLGCSLHYTRSFCAKKRPVLRDSVSSGGALSRVCCLQELDRKPSVGHSCNEQVCIPSLSGPALVSRRLLILLELPLGKLAQPDERPSKNNWTPWDYGNDYDRVHHFTSLGKNFKVWCTLVKPEENRIRLDLSEHMWIKMKNVLFGWHEATNRTMERPRMLLRKC